MTNISPITDRYWRNFPPENNMADVHGLLNEKNRALSLIARVGEYSASIKLQEIAKAAKEIAIHGQQSYVEVLDSVLNFLNHQKSTSK